MRQLLESRNGLVLLHLTKPKKLQCLLALRFLAHEKNNAVGSLLFIVDLLYQRF